MSTVASLDDWKTESLRFTAFLDAVENLDTTTWWAALVDTPSESRTVRPREAKSVDEGDVGGVRMILDVSGPRFDVHLAANLEPALRDGNLDALPSVREPLSLLQSVVSRWTALGIGVSRIALGAVLLRPAIDKVDGYRVLQSFLSDVRIDPERSSDLVYRINRPRPSTEVKGMVINRVSTWTVTRFNRAYVSLVPTDGAVAAQSTTTIAGPCAARLELDVNTFPRSERLSNAEVCSLAREIHLLVEEILMSGDVA